MDILVEKPVDPIKKAAKKAKRKTSKELSSEKIRLALERLQLAWLRTAITFIALGFTSYKFYYSRIQEGKEPLTDFVNGRDIGIFLIAIGFLGLLLASLQHRKNHAKLKSVYPEIMYSVSLLQSYFILVFAFVLLIVFIFQF